MTDLHGIRVVLNHDLVIAKRELEANFLAIAKRLHALEHPEIVSPNPPGSCQCAPGQFVTVAPPGLVPTCQGCGLPVKGDLHESA